jgi:Protein of unknown function (DUF3307)
MDLINKVALSGGLFAVFTFIHFVVDWIFQTHSEAMAKHNNPWVRARHCLIYTIGFIPLLLVLGLAWWEILISINILFWSHFVEDTYLPVYLWAKYIRRPPEMVDPWKETFRNVDGSVSIKVNPPDARRGFLEFVQTPLGKILMIAVDQIIHLAFLFPIVWLVLRHITIFIK